MRLCVCEHARSQTEQTSFVRRVGVGVWECTHRVVCILLIPLTMRDVRTRAAVQYINIHTHARVHTADRPTICSECARALHHHPTLAAHDDSLHFRAMHATTRRTVFGIQSRAGSRAALVPAKGSRPENCLSQRSAGCGGCFVVIECFDGSETRFVRGCLCWCSRETCKHTRRRQRRLAYDSRAYYWVAWWTDKPKKKEGDTNGTRARLNTLYIA